MKAAEIKADITKDMHAPSYGTRARVEYIGALIADLEEFAEFTIFEDEDLKTLEQLHDKYCEED